MNGNLGTVRRTIILLSGFRLVSANAIECQNPFLVLKQGLDFSLDGPGLEDGTAPTHHTRGWAQLFTELHKILVFVLGGN